MDLHRGDLPQLDAVLGVVLIPTVDGVGNLDLLDVPDDGVDLRVVPHSLV